MPEAATAATILSPSPAPAPAAPPAAAPAPAVGNAAALAAVPAATDTPAAAPAPAAAPTPAAWYGDLSANPELKAFAETKQFKDPAAALESQRNLERLVGVPADQLIRKPKDANDAEGIKAYRAALGVPDVPEAYGITPQDNPASHDFVKWASETFLSADVSKENAAKIVAGWNAFAVAEELRGKERDAVAFQNGMAKVQAEWGTAFGERMELAKREMRAVSHALGVRIEDGDQMFEGLKTAAGGGPLLIKMLAYYGARTSEDKFQGSGNVPAFTPTPEQADAKMAALLADPEWTKAYSGGDKTKQQEWQNWLGIKNGTPPIKVI